MCKFCRGNNDQHAADCPRESPTAEIDYNEGWDDGRLGFNRTCKSSAYRYSWIHGDAARDAFFNDVQ